MIPRLVLLYTRDSNFDRLLTEALVGTGVIVLIARSVADALQIICRRGRELDLVVMDFNEGCRGMTLLSAIHTCYQNLPTLVITAKDLEYANGVAYANGAGACLSKPLPAVKLANAIADLYPAQAQLVVA